MAPTEIMEQEMRKVADPPHGYEHLERLGSEIDRFEKNLAVLETRLRPVLGVLLDTDEVMVDSAPDHEFHVVIKRLANMNDALDSLINRIRL